MNKKLIFTISITIVVLIILVSVFFTIFPFGTIPKGTRPNCGPENTYKFDIKINSTEDVVNFLKDNDGKILDQYGRNLVKLDNFKDLSSDMNYSNLKTADIDWNKVKSEIKVINLLFRKIYTLKYNPYGCKGYTLKMTNNGYVSIYGCCGI